jgi:flagellar basal-body rod protein FlgB
MIMPSEALFGSTLVMLEKLIDFQADRHTVLATNIANIDTPGYKGSDLRFSDELKKAASSKGSISLKKTNEKHLPLKVGAMQGVRHQVTSSSGDVHRLDGNTVDLDKEMAKLSENSLYYNTAVRILSKKLGLIRTAVSEVR